MSNLKLQWLADEIKAAGGNVVEWAGWKTHTVPKTYEFKPVGLINHHTAPPVPFPVQRLVNACNITIAPDGTIYTVNAGVANDSGYGDPAVLNRVVSDMQIKAPTDKFQSDRVTGNPWFIDIEVQHLGDGGPLPVKARESLIICNAVIMKHFGWAPETRLIGHREWTTRKTDPRWDGTVNPMPAIRADTRKKMEGDNMAQLTEEEVQMLKHLVASVKDRGSNGGFAGQAIDLIRKERENPLHLPSADGGSGIKSGDTVRINKV